MGHIVNGDYGVDVIVIGNSRLKYPCCMPLFVKCVCASSSSSLFLYSMC